SEEHTSELQSLTNLVCRLLLEKKKKNNARNLKHDIPPLTLMQTKRATFRRIRTEARRLTAQVNKSIVTTHDYQCKPPHHVPCTLHAMSKHLWSTRPSLASAFFHTRSMLTHSVPPTHHAPHICPFDLFERLRHILLLFFFFLNNTPPPDFYPFPLPAPLPI